MSVTMQFSINAEQHDAQQYPAIAPQITVIPTSAVNTEDASNKRDEDLLIYLQPICNAIASHLTTVRMHNVLHLQY